MTYQVKAHEQESDLIVTYWQDAEPALEVAAAFRREHREATSFAKRGEFRRTMIVPMVTIMAVCEKYHLNFFDKDDAKKIMKILKGSEYKLFRTTNDKRI